MYSHLVYVCFGNRIWMSSMWAPPPHPPPPPIPPSRSVLYIKGVPSCIIYPIIDINIRKRVLWVLVTNLNGMYYYNYVTGSMWASLSPPTGPHILFPISWYILLVQYWLHVDIYSGRNEISARNGISALTFKRNFGYVLQTLMTWNFYWLIFCLYTTIF